MPPLRKGNGWNAIATQLIYSVDEVILYILNRTIKIFFPTKTRNVGKKVGGSGVLDSLQPLQEYYLL